MLTPSMWYVVRSAVPHAAHTDTDGGCSTVGSNFSGDAAVGRGSEGSIGIGGTGVSRDSSDDSPMVEAATSRRKAVRPWSLAGGPSEPNRTLFRAGFDLDPKDKAL